MLETVRDEKDMEKCQSCSQEISQEDGYQEGGQLLCEDCYFDLHHKIKTCDPWGVHSKKVFREKAGLEGTSGLADIQKKIYEFVVSRNGATMQEIAQELGISPGELQNQFSILRHCELLKGQDREGIIYVVPFDA
jgi:late competence protein required for DNA uptake (superfamily II DNA/RNA helicase)